MNYSTPTQAEVEAYNVPCEMTLDDKFVACVVTTVHFLVGGAHIAITDLVQN